MLSNPDCDHTVQESAIVLIPGLPQPLSYSIPEHLASSVEAGSQVLVPLGSRRVSGWVIECTSSRYPESTSENKDWLNTSEKHFANPKREATIKSFKLKPIQSAFGAFPSSQLKLFHWFSEYYCCSLTEAIENAIPVVANQPKRKLPVQTHDEGHSIPEDAPSAIIRIPTLTSSQEKVVTNLSTAIEEAVFSPFLLFGVTGSGKTEVYIRCINKVLEMGKTALVIVPEIALTPQLFRNFSERIAEPIAVLHSQLAKGLRWDTWRGLLEGRVRVAIGARSAVFAPLKNLGIVIVDEEHESSYKQSDGLRYHARDTAIVRAKLSSCPVVLGSATPSFESLMNAKRGKYKIMELPERVTQRPVPTIEIVDLAKIKSREMASPNISPQLLLGLQETFSKGEQAVVLYNRRGFSSFLQCSTCGDVLQCPHCAVSLTFHKKKNLSVCHYCGYSAAPLLFCPTCRDPRLTTVNDEGDAAKVGEIVHRGGGTERIEEEILLAFPNLRIARMDRDTVTQKDAHSRILDEMRHGKADLLLGTQMIAKGHDLPRVTLVGVIDADVGLHFPDFRANERVFQLITQAAGRAGRAELPGRVIVQTRQANHPTMVALATGRFKAFARYELEFRERLKYPPFARMMRVIISSPDLLQSERTAETISRVLRQITAQGSKIALGPTSPGPTSPGSNSPSPNSPGPNSDERVLATRELYSEVLGPSPAPIEKLRGRYRYHLIVKSDSAKFISFLGQRVMGLRQELCKKGDLRITVDIDPIDML